MEIAIRPYRQADWGRLTEIHDAARRMELHHAGLDAAFVPLSVSAEREGLFDHTVMVAEAQGDVLGFVAYSGDELAWLYVDPAHGRKGIGRQLIAHVLESLPHRPLHIEVLAGNEPAIRLYHALGFETVGLSTGEMPGNEAFRVTVERMERR